jgi:hypothetical protein
MEAGRPGRRLAREHEVKATMLHEWKRKFGSSVRSTAPAPTDLGSLPEENRSLKSEVARIRQREEILKNARHPPRTMYERFQRIEAMKADYPIAAASAEALHHPSQSRSSHGHPSAPGPRASPGH